MIENCKRGFDVGVFKKFSRTKQDQMNLDL